MELQTQVSSISNGHSPKKSSRVQPLDNKSTLSVSDDDDHHRHRHRHHHHRDHRSHRSHNRHHHHSRHRHHHHRRRRSYSPESDYSYEDRHHAYDYSHHHHRSQIAPLPKIIVARPAKVITPTPTKSNTAIYRDAGINTGTETKIMKDSSVGADLEELSSTVEDRLSRIPVVRRTIIVEPYPAEPSSQIIVKPRADGFGRIRLGKTSNLDGKNGETIVYPSTSFLTKRSKSKKKKGTMVNNNLIEDLRLDDIAYESRARTKRTNNDKMSGSKSIKNAFYN